MKHLLLSDERLAEPVDLRDILEIDDHGLDIEPIPYLTDQLQLWRSRLAKPTDLPYKDKSVLTCTPHRNR